MTLSYAPTEMKVPPNASLGHLEWIAFSWDLQVADLQDPGRVLFFQYLLAPGVVVFRVRERSDPDSLFAVGSQVPFTMNTLGEDGMFDGAPATITEVAENLTKNLFLNSSRVATWMRTPFVVDFNDDVKSPFTKQYFLDMDPSMFGFETVNTLGDALAYGDPPLLGRVFDRVAQVRAETSINPS